MVNLPPSSDPSKAPPCSSRYGVKEDIIVFLPVLLLAHDKGESERGCRKPLPFGREGRGPENTAVDLRHQWPILL